jgi:hypothetical protein
MTTGTQPAAREHPLATMAREFGDWEITGRPGGLDVITAYWTSADGRLSFARSMGPGCCHDLGTTAGSLCHLGAGDAVRQVAGRLGRWRLR